MMEKVTQMIAMLIKAWKKESVSQIDTPPVPATPEPKQPDVPLFCSDVPAEIP